MTLTLLFVGIAASLFTEVATWLNLKLSATVLKGDGAFLLAAIVALAFAIVQFFATGGGTLSTFVSHFTEIWASSTAFFLVILQTCGIDVSAYRTV